MRHSLGIWWVKNIKNSNNKEWQLQPKMRPTLELNSRNKIRRGEETWHFWSSAFISIDRSLPLLFMIQWILSERNRPEDMKKLKKISNLPHKAKRQMLPSTILKTCLWDGTVSRFHIGCISFMGWESNTNAKSVETTAIGAEEHFRCIFNNGDIPMVWSAWKFLTQFTSRTLQLSTMPSLFIKS